LPPGGQTQCHQGRVGSDLAEAGESDGMKKKVPIIFHLPVTVVSDLPYLQETWIWWSTPEVLHHFLDKL
jgi:hypothetical protein